MPKDLSGQVLAETYLVEQLLGRGGMGAVYRGRHLRTGGQVAIKALHREAAVDSAVYRRFQDEAQIISSLHHPNIVQVMDFNTDEDGAPFLVMELLEGEDLHRRLRREQRLPLAQVLDIAGQVGSALHAVHQKGIVHRDIKPQNIFLLRHELTTGEAELCKVLDFGISKIQHSLSAVTKEDMVLGTPEYMSPEAAKGRNSEVDARADQFSLAVVLYQALSGRRPFVGAAPMATLYQVIHERAEPLSKIVPDLPPGVAAAIERAMAKDKERRFPSMAEFITALTQAPRAPAEPSPRSLVMAAAVGMALMLGWLLWRDPRPVTLPPTPPRSPLSVVPPIPPTVTPLVEPPPQPAPVDAGVDAALRAPPRPRPRTPRSLLDPGVY